MAVVADGYGDTTATLTAYQKGRDGWTQVFGPWVAEIGEGGFAPPGEKEEGDLRTPSGSYGFGFFFGIDPEPRGHVSLECRSATSDVWDDDPSSPNYNEWIDESTEGVAAAGADPEPMYDPPYYDYGAVIDYNMYPVSHTPPDGSAIFFHYSTGPTVGCVALPEIARAVEVLQWLNPDDDPADHHGHGVGGGVLRGRGMSTCRSKIGELGNIRCLLIVRLAQTPTHPGLRLGREGRQGRGARRRGRGRPAVRGRRQPRRAAGRGLDRTGGSSR